MSAQTRRFKAPQVVFTTQFRAFSRLRRRGGQVRAEAAQVTAVWIGSRDFEVSLRPMACLTSAARRNADDDLEPA
jgi:hypothetical protein